MTDLMPDDAPKTARELSARIYASLRPDIDVLRLMVLLEASGEGTYADLARAANDPTISGLLRRNGREELAHAHRVKKVIRILSGIEYEVPVLEHNPYYTRRDDCVLTQEILLSMAASELRGEALYETWADNTDNAKAAALFRQNGIEERRHGARLEQAAGLLLENSLPLG